MFHIRNISAEISAVELAPEISPTDWVVFAIGCALCVGALWVTNWNTKHDSSEGSSETNAKLVEFKLR